MTDYKESAYIEYQRRLERELADAESRIDSIASTVRGLGDDTLPPLWMMNTIGSHSATHFKQIASWAFAELARRGRITTSSKVVDIGSGCGRIAIPFSHLIKTGRYFGVDVFADGVKWCNENIAKSNPAFEFFLQKVDHNYYFGEAAVASKSMSMAFAETDSIDLVHALSVLTHLVEADTQSYLAEINRCLRANGLAYLTCFIIDEDFHEFVKRTGLYTAVTMVSEGHFQAYSGQDFFAAYTMDRWAELLRESGLEVVGYEPGTWVQKPGSTRYQDTFLLTRRSAPSYSTATTNQLLKLNNGVVHNYPNFLVVGFMKAATSTVFDHLLEHPRVQAPRKKELHYFTRELDRFYDNTLFGLEYHEQLNFDPSSDKIYGEASPSYIAAADRIRAFNPNTKIIILVRDPVDRALSQYRQYREYGVLGSDVVAADVDSLGTFEFVEASEYEPWVRSFLRKFPAKNVLLVSFEEFCADQTRAMNAVFEFLGLEPIPVDANKLLGATEKADENVELRAHLDAYFQSRRGKVAKLVRQYKPATYPAAAEAFERY